MSYVKSYIGAFLDIGRWIGLLYLLSSFLIGDAASFFFVYLILSVSLSGPLGVFINRRSA